MASTKEMPHDGGRDARDKMLDDINMPPATRSAASSSKSPQGGENKKQKKRPTADGSSGIFRMSTKMNLLTYPAVKRGSLTVG